MPCSLYKIFLVILDADVSNPDSVSGLTLGIPRRRISVYIPKAERRNSNMTDITEKSSHRGSYVEGISGSCQVSDTARYTMPETLGDIHTYSDDSPDSLGRPSFVTVESMSLTSGEPDLELTFHDVLDIENLPVSDLHETEKKLERKKRKKMEGKQGRELQEVYRLSDLSLHSKEDNLFCKEKIKLKVNWKTKDECQADEYILENEDGVSRSAVGQGHTLIEDFSKSRSEGRTFSRNSKQANAQKFQAKSKEQSTPGAKSSHAHRKVRKQKSTIDGKNDFSSLPSIQSIIQKILCVSTHNNEKRSTDLTKQNTLDCNHHGDGILGHVESGSEIVRDQQICAPVIMLNLTDQKDVAQQTKYGSERPNSTCAREKSTTHSNNNNLPRTSSLPNIGVFNKPLCEELSSCHGPPHVCLPKFKARFKPKKTRKPSKLECQPCMIE